MTSLWTEERKASALASYDKWRGTPHKDRVRKVGIGIDCVGLIFEILYDSKVLPRLPIAGLYCKHDVNSKKEKPNFEELFYCERVSLDDLQFGDICICDWSNFWWHPMFYTDKQMIHITRDGWVKKVSESIWDCRVGWAFRFYKEGFAKDIDFIHLGEFQLAK